MPSLFRIPPRIFNGWEGTEKVLMARFQKQALPFLQIEPKDDVEWLALAQHHGMPTRLLDWSENPLVALFFAVENLCVNHDSAVWAATTNITNHTIVNPTNHLDGTLYSPAFTTPRISAQRGCFTVHTIPNRGSSFVELEAPNRHDQIQTVIGSLDKYIIRAELREDIKWQLDKVGIDYFTLFPDLDGLCKRIRWDIDKTIYGKPYPREGLCLKCQGGD